MPHAARRMILADDNIRDTGGHFFELAALLMEGGQQLGYQPILATHARFVSDQALPSDWELHPVFRTRRLLRWSLGVDGSSRVERNRAGLPCGGSTIENVWRRARERMIRPSRRPTRMLSTWSTDLAALLTRLVPGPNDRLVINTGDDFAMLALAAALKKARLVTPLRVDVIFHFAVYEAGDAPSDRRREQFGNQVRRALDELRPHDVRLHATTAALAEQLVETAIGVPIGSIPYPTRPRLIRQGLPDEPLKVVLAGLPRAEKGRDAIRDLLEQVRQPLLDSGRLRISLQLPPKRWQRMIPASLHDDYHTARQLRDYPGAANQAARWHIQPPRPRLCGGEGRGEGVSGEALSLQATTFKETDGIHSVDQTRKPSSIPRLEVMTSNLTTSDYHRWLDTADVGLFLYEPSRYVARCSGVLLEMFARGIPVIVPDGCWLATQVREAGLDHPIGLIYRQRSEIPRLLERVGDQYAGFRAAAIRHAEQIRCHHAGRNTIAAMTTAVSRTYAASA